VTDEAFETISVQFAHYLPKDVKPVLTAVGVTTLAIPGQLFEIDVEAWSPQ
jgi:hypothetical protein